MRRVSRQSRPTPRADGLLADASLRTLWTTDLLRPSPGRGLGGPSGTFYPARCHTDWLRPGERSAGWHLVSRMSPGAQLSWAGPDPGGLRPARCECVPVPGGTPPYRPGQPRPQGAYGLQQFSAFISRLTDHERAVAWDHSHLGHSAQYRRDGATGHAEL